MSGINPYGTTNWRGWDTWMPEADDGEYLANTAGSATVNPNQQQQTPSSPAVVVTLGAATTQPASYAPPISQSPSGQWEGWDVRELLSAAKSIGLTPDGMDAQNANFWLLFTDIDPPFGDQPGDENLSMDQLDHRAWTKSLAKAAGVSFESYLEVLTSERYHRNMASAEASNAGGSYFFSFDPTGGPSANSRFTQSRIESDFRHSGIASGSMKPETFAKAFNDYVKAWKDAQNPALVNTETGNGDGAWVNVPMVQTESYDDVTKMTVVTGGFTKVFVPTAMKQGFTEYDTQAEFQVAGRAGGYSLVSSLYPYRRDFKDPASWLMSTAEQPGNSNLLFHNDAVKSKGRAVAAQIDSLRVIIDTAATTYQVDANLIRAIIFEEQTKATPAEGFLESLGAGSTVGLGQMTIGYYGLSREQLQDPTIGVHAIARHIEGLTNRNSAPLPDSNRFVASIGSRYNNATTTQVTNYGRRIELYYNMFVQRQ